MISGNPSRMTVKASRTCSLPSISARILSRACISKRAQGIGIRTSVVPSGSSIQGPKSFCFGG